MSELVLLHHNEPMTTSLAIAAGTENEHASVMILVRKFISELETFGKVSFEVAPEGNSRFEIGNSVVEVNNPRDSKGRRTEIAFLNEPQATLLITFLRNSEIVVRFKVALVKAFYEMRDRLRAAAPQFTTRQLDHGADLAVSADRTFRSFLRSARSAGLRLPQALAVANRQTVARTGMDMLAELGVEPDAIAPEAAGKTGAAAFFELWLRGELPVPCCIVKTTDLFDAYCLWERLRGGTHESSPQRFYYVGKSPEFGIKKTTIDAGSPKDRWTVRVVIPPGALATQGAELRHVFYARQLRSFTEALARWRTETAA